MDTALGQLLGVALRRLDVVVLGLRLYRPIQQVVAGEDGLHMGRLVILQAARVDARHIVVDGTQSVLDLHVVGEHRMWLLTQHQAKISAGGRKRKVIKRFSFALECTHLSWAEKFKRMVCASPLGVVLASSTCRFCRKRACSRCLTWAACSTPRSKFAASQCLM